MFGSMQIDGERLRDWRERRALSQRELADDVGLSPATISRIETGQRTETRPSSLRKLAVALKCDPTDLAPART